MYVFVLLKCAGSYRIIQADSLPASRHYSTLKVNRFKSLAADTKYWTDITVHKKKWSLNHMFNLCSLYIKKIGILWSTETWSFPVQSTVRVQLYQSWSLGRRDSSGSPRCCLYPRRAAAEITSEVALLSSFAAFICMKTTDIFTM